MILISKKVKAFVAQQTGARVEEIVVQTELVKELGVDGDDAIEFFEKFSEEFQVDLSTFKFNKHFGTEAAFDPVLWLVSILSRTPADVEVGRLDPTFVPKPPFFICNTTDFGSNNPLSTDPRDWFGFLSPVDVRADFRVSHMDLLNDPGILRELRNRFRF